MTSLSSGLLFEYAVSQRKTINRGEKYETPFITVQSCISSSMIPISDLSFKSLVFRCYASLLFSVLESRGKGGYSYFSVRGRAAEQGIIFRIPTAGQGIILIKIGSATGSIRSFLILKRRCRPFTLREYDLTRLGGNMSTFSDRFLTNFNGRAQFCLRKLEARVLFKNLPLRDRVSFSGIGLRDRVTFKIFLRHLAVPYVRRPDLWVQSHL